MEFTRKEAKQWALKNVRGLYMCPLTPVTPDFKFDEAGIRENIEKYVDMGIDGLVVGGFISECWNVVITKWWPMRPRGGWICGPLFLIRKLVLRLRK